MTATPPGIAQRYAFALAHAFARSAGPAASEVDISALATFFEQQFTREALRLPADGRDEFLSAVALEMLGRMGQAGSGGASLPELEDAFKRATLTVLDTIRHRIARARARDRMREGGLDDAETLPRAASGPDLEGLLRRELAGRLSADEMTVLYLVTQGRPVEEIARRMNVSRRTIYRALGAIRASLEASRREDTD